MLVLKEVQGAKRYSFNDRDSGRLVEGVNVFFLAEAKNGDEVGKIPAKVTLPISSWEKVKRLYFPLDCQAVVEQEFTNKGIKSRVVDLMPFSEKK